MNDNHVSHEQTVLSKTGLKYLVLQDVFLDILPYFGCIQVQVTFKTTQS